MAAPKKRLFKFAVLLHPTEEEAKAGKSTEVLVKPKDEYTLASSEQEIFMLAIQEVPKDKVTEAADRLEVAVHPF